MSSRAADLPFAQGQLGETTPLLGGFGQTDSKNNACRSGSQTFYQSEPRENVEAAVETVPPPSDVAPPYKTFSQIWVTCLALWIGIFAAAMSATIVANVQVEIGSYFDAGSLASWLGTAFLLGVIAINPLCGRLVDVIGGVNCFISATVVFLVGTMLCAVSPSIFTVLFARAITGIGSGGISTSAAIILARLVSPADRGIYQGGGSVLQAAGSAAGGLIGGMFNDWLGWRSVFWLQIPAIILTILIAGTQFESGRDGKRTGSSWSIIKRVDWAGWSSLFLAVLGMTVGLTFRNQGFDWAHPLVIGTLLTSTASCAGFIVAEARATEPLLPLSLLKRTQTMLLLVANAPLTAMWFARVYFQPVYLQIVRDMTSFQTGSTTLPFTVVAAVISLYAGWHMRFFKEYKWLLVVTPAFSWLQALNVILSWGLSTDVTRLWLELALAGFGAIPYTSLTTALLVSVDPDEIALAVSATYVFRAIGQIWGIAIGSAIQQSVLKSSLLRRFPTAPTLTISRIVNNPATCIPELDLISKVQARMAYFESIQAVFAYIAGLGLILSIMCLGVRARPF